MAFTADCSGYGPNDAAGRRDSAFGGYDNTEQVETAEHNRCPFLQGTITVLIWQQGEIMADITPTDIVNKQFRATLRGYDRNEVDDFLQQASDSLYRALEESQRLRAQIDDLRGRLQHFQDSEDLIKNALLLAERTADETRQHAHQEADLMRREAEHTLRTERAEMEELRQTRHRMVAELRAILHAHLNLLDAQDGRPAPALSRGEAG